MRRRSVSKYIRVNLFDIGVVGDYTYPLQNVTSFVITGNSMSGNTTSSAGNGAVLHNKKHSVAQAQTYSMSAVFSADARFIVRCLDENSNMLTSGLSAGIYNSFYKAYFFTTSPASFTINSATVKFIQFGVVFIKTGSTNTVETISNIQLEPDSSNPYEPYLEPWEI